jgi:hypothetical protein
MSERLQKVKIQIQKNENKFQWKTKFTINISYEMCTFK